jgi:hypothetical protein
MQLNIYLEMKALFNLLLLISIVSFSQKAWSQGVTYTTNGTCASTLGTYWSSPTCWTKTGTCNSSNVPPTGAGTSACPIRIVINHTVNIASLNLENFHTLEVGPNGVLNISTNITQTREVTSNILVNGGRINLTGSLNPTSGRNGQPKTILNINLTNDGQFTIGGTFNLDNQTEINIDGDGSSNVVTNNIDLGNNAMINVKAGGGLIVNNSTSYSGNSSSINVEGIFETQNLTIFGGGQTELNVTGNAQVTVKGNVGISGDSKMFFGGDSNVLIEGNIEINGTQSGLTLGENNTTKVEG